MQQVHAIVLSGGSAFGLDAATGVVRYLEEKGVGYDVGIAKVPIVPAAILFDLGVGGKPKVRPTAECGYAAAQAATDGPVAEGNVGAGAGATVGKMRRARARSMKAGIGTASITTAGRPGRGGAGRRQRRRRHHRSRHRASVVAGVRTADGKGLADARTLVRSGASARGARAAPGRRGPAENTTIGVVATNAVLTKAQALKVAQMAHDGFARAISPAHTPVRRRHHLRAGHGHARRRGERRPDRRPGRGGDGGRDRARGHPGGRESRAFRRPATSLPRPRGRKRLTAMGDGATLPPHMTAHGMRPASVEIASWRAAVRPYAFAYFFYFSNGEVGAVA